MAIANITGNILTDSGVATSSLLPLTGGTLTGALNGTSATFSGSVLSNTSFKVNNNIGYLLRTDNDVSNLGGLSRRSYWAGGAALDTQIFAETGYGIYLNVDGGSTKGLFITSGGNLQITASDSALYTRAAAAGKAIYWDIRNSSDARRGYIGFGGDGSSDFQFSNNENGSQAFITNGTERMRIQSDGRIIKAANNTQTGQFQIGGQTGSPPNAILVSAADENGPYPIGIKALSATPSQGLFGFFNSANATQGSITINGSDVSYNSFMGSHWSQLSDNSKPEILKGTILEAIDELCKWEGEINDRLPKIKISDTIESKNVYGVFFDWDNMDDFNDMYVAALGAGYIRVNSNEVVSMGDLLQSNGDGTAKVQSDDIMRSSTIAKVVSTQKIETYEDGSYLIAATLHCG